MSPLAAAVLCFVLSLAMHLPWLAITPIAGTEGHRIFPAHAMVQTRWWLVPTLFDQPFMTKPPLHHWLIAMSEMASGGGRAFDIGGPKALFFWRLPSAITGALLCAAVCWFGARWFGKMAGLISGLCAVGMLTLWGQSQVADIDSTNTLASVLAALCGVELLVAYPKRRVTWLALSSLAMAAMWMTKGPAGLPIVLGVWLWPPGLTVYQFFAGRSSARHRPQPSTEIPTPADPVATIRSLAGAQEIGLVLDYRTRDPAQPRPSFRRQFLAAIFWLLPLLIGIAVFVGWALAAKHSLLAHGFQLDRRGMKEGTDRLFAKSFGVLFQSLFVMLPQAIAFGLPTTLALPLYFRGDVRSAIDPSKRPIARALIAATLISWGVCVISGMINPRYAYPTLMLLCPLAGAVAVAAVRTPRAGDWLRAIAMISVFAFVMATIGLSFGSRHATHFGYLLIPTCFLAIFAAAVTLQRLARSWTGAWGLVALMMLASIPFGVQRHWARTYKDSAITIAPRLRQTIGENGALAVCGAATSKPEAFYYARVRPDFIPLYAFIPQHVQSGTWIMLDQAEHKRWLAQPDSRLEKDEKICRWGETDYYLAWYPKRDEKP